MKRLLFFVLIAISLSHFSNAQYRINKYKYSPKMYSPQMGDPYNPTVAGLASFLIPGLGQMVSKEPGRGIAFLVSYVGLYVFAISNVPKYDAYGNYVGGNPVFGTVSLLGMVGVGIASIVDAVKVAKVNNLAFRDQNKSAFKLEIKPYLSGSTYNSKVNPNIGLTLGVKF